MAGGDFRLEDAAGNVITFYGFDSSVPTKQQGKLKERVDAGGNKTVAVYHTDGRIDRVARGDAIVDGQTINSGFTVSEEYVYGWNTAEDRVESVTLRRSSDDGATWETVRVVHYTYYGIGDDNGTEGDLKFAEVREVIGGSEQQIDKSYYRYHVSGTEGADGLLQSALRPDHYERLAATTSNVDNETDAEVGAYAAAEFSYDSDNRVSRVEVQDAGKSGEYTYTYATASSGRADARGEWHDSTFELMPGGGGERRAIYSNAFGQPILSVEQDWDFDNDQLQGAGTSDEREWATFRSYDAHGRLRLMANPSAVDGYAENDANLLGGTFDALDGLKDGDGLVTTFDYAPADIATSSEAGEVEGYVRGVSIQRGEFGTVVPQQTMLYADRNGNSVTETVNATDFTYDTEVHPIASRTRFTAEDGTGAESTTFDYFAANAWHAGTVQSALVVTTLPTVSVDRNGSGTATTLATTFDEQGRPIWTRDGDGYLTRTSYDEATSAVTGMVTDVDVSLTSDEPAGWTSPDGANSLHLVTTYDVDEVGRVTRHEHPSGREDFTVYDDQDITTWFYPAWRSSASGGPLLPVERVEFARANGERAETAYLYPSLTTAPAVPDGSEAVADDAYTFTQARKFSLAGRTVGVAGYQGGGGAYGTTRRFGFSNFDRLDALLENEDIGFTSYGYDDYGRVISRVDRGTTITRWLLDPLGRPIQEWVGTEDFGATINSPGAPPELINGLTNPYFVIGMTKIPGNNLLQVAAYEWDDGEIGDGNLTLIDHFGKASTDERRAYDWRNRAVSSARGRFDQFDPAAGTTSVSEVQHLTYDNLDRVVTADRFGAQPSWTGFSYVGGVPDAPAASTLTHRSTTSFDEVGQTYRESIFSIEPDTGTVSTSALDTDVWYDRRGNAVKADAPGGLVTKQTFDGAGRLTLTSLGEDKDDAAYADAFDSSGDLVLEEEHSVYDDNGNLILTTIKQRHHDATGFGSLGDTDSGVNARVSHNAFYYDDADRLTATANFGFVDDHTWTRPTAAPHRSDDLLVTTYEYGWGLAEDSGIWNWSRVGNDESGFGGVKTYRPAYVLTTGPRDIATREKSDHYGRRSELIENFLYDDTNEDNRWLRLGHTGLDNVIVPTEDAHGNAQADANRTTTWVYNGSEQITEQVAYVGPTSNSSDRQTTTYQYGVRIDLSDIDVTQGRAVGGSDANRDDVLGKVTYPETSTGSETFTYAMNGQRTGMTDRNGTEHAYGYDLLGRRTSDEITTLGSATNIGESGLNVTIDNTVDRLEWTYNDAGRLFTATSLDGSAGVLNQIQREYNGLGQLVREYQAHDGEVNDASEAGTDTLWVGYAYSEMAGGANHSRLESMTYPSGRVLDYVYDGGTDGVDARVSRLSGLAEDQGGSLVTLEAIDYLGLNTLVGRRGGESGIDLVYYAENPAAGVDPYTGLDRFGRVIDQRWVDSYEPSWVDVDRYAYGYDRDGNRLYEENLLSAAHSELYHDGTGYDGLGRVTSFERGTLNTAKDGLTGTADPYQDWTLDAVGNWDAFDNDGTSQTRDHDKENRLTEVTEGGTDDDFHHSKNGEIVEAFGTAGTDVFIYDAWGRLAGFDSDYATANVGETDFEYDALNRRMVSEGEVHYHTKDWQVIEERDATSGQLDTQYVWSPAYIDAMVLRDRDTTGDGVVGVGDERLYVLHDANFNVTGLVAETQPDDWNVVERYLFDPYGGNRVVLDGTWTLLGTGLAAGGYAFEHGFQGGRHLQYTDDQRDVLIHFRNRDLLTRAGRWMRQDPAGYVDGASLYTHVRENPVKFIDPIGLQGNDNSGNAGKKRAHQKDRNDADINSSGSNSDRGILDGVTPGADEAKDFQDAMMEKYEPSRNLHEAARHVYWSAYLTYYFGPHFARFATNLKEMTDKGRDDIERDLLNNELGREVGRNANSREDLWRLSEQAIREGKIWGVDGPGRWSRFKPELQ
jgi:RHS repeat-associated protein